MRDKFSILVNIIIFIQLAVLILLTKQITKSRMGIAHPRVNIYFS